MKSHFVFYKVTLIGAMTFAVLQPLAWSDVVTKSKSAASVTSENKSPNAPVVKMMKGRTRLLSFPYSISKVSSSNVSVINTQPINARTIAITGIGLGNAELTVALTRPTGKVIADPAIYRIQVREPETLSPRAIIPQRQGITPLNTERIAQALGRQWPNSSQSFEEMLIAEIQKRDLRIKELETQIKEKQP